MNYIDLFSGIGGFALGAYWAGMHFDNHYFSEIDPYCVELYQKRFPNAIPLGDIRGIDCEKLADTDIKGLEGRNGEVMRERSGKRAVGKGRTWLITGGFPCVDISVAGKGAGIRGSRSGLWFEMWRIIRDLRPRFAIIENVAMLTNRGLDVVLSNLAEIGYDAEWQDIRAEDVGAPHRRERIWIVAYPCELGQREPQRTGDSISDGNGFFSQPLRKAQQQHGPSGNGESATEMADAEDTDRRGPSEEEDSGGRDTEVGGRSISGSRLQYWAAIAGLGGFTHDVSPWLDGSWEHGVQRLASKVPRRVDRLRGLGNSIIPVIAELLFCKIQEAMDVQVQAEKD